MNTTQESAPTARPAAALLRAGAGLGGLAGAVVAAVCLLVSGRAGGSAMVGALLATAALSVGPLLMAATRTSSPPAVMAFAMAGYALTVLVLAIAYVLLGAVPWLSGVHVAYGIVATTAAWLAGQARAVARLRVLAYGAGTQGDARPPPGSDADSPASPPTASH